MRVVVYGIGAIGGTLASRLSLAGTEVIGISRGNMLAAIRAKGGLTVITHIGREFTEFPVVSDPSQIDFRPDDVILLTMKTNDTAAALEALLYSGVEKQAIVCAQNGVANERMSLRFFPNVFGMVMMMPTQFTEPGVVVGYGKPKLGILDIGRYPSGADASVEPLVAALNAAEFVSALTHDVMQEKYGKLLLNLSNIATTALESEVQEGYWYQLMRAEAEATYAAAGIAYTSVDFDHPRRSVLKPTPIPGVEKAGTSTVQSLIRKTGSVETDYFNGEIVLLGRLHGVPTPVNLAFCKVARRMLRHKITPGTFPEKEIERLVAGI